MTDKILTYDVTIKERIQSIYPYTYGKMTPFIKFDNTILSLIT